MRHISTHCLSAFLKALLCLFVFTPVQAGFVNFETPTINGLALNKSGTLLAVCNLPDGRIEFFRPGESGLSLVGSVPVGVDPVSVRFRTDSELWVVNHLSDTINIIDTTNFRVVALVDTSVRPADVVFAGAPERAFVSGWFHNLIQVFDPRSRELITNIAVLGQRPASMTVSPDGLTVYCAIKESGNKTTILSRTLTNLNRFSSPGAIEHPSGPYAGLNPPPNRGGEFFPALNRSLGTNLAPPVSLIVKKQPDGRWTDDNNGDWTEFISGTNAHLSGRIQGWDMLDHDVAVLSANDLSLSYLDGLMTIVLGLGVNPGDGSLAVVGTDHLNHIRFEPNLRGIFARVNIALANPKTGAVQIRDLNPHLDYKTNSVPWEIRQKSVGDPRAVLWSQDGSRAYVAARGSDNLLVLDRDGQRAAEPIPLPAGPEALAADQTRLYVLSRFAAEVIVLDLATLKIVQRIALHDPTPLEIRKGRVFLYNTHETSGLGHVACGTCHVDARFDRLGWDLGNPSATLRALAPIQRITGNTTVHFENQPVIPEFFHPMKGPMLTQTLQDIMEHQPFHWRGDRFEIQEFDVTFRDLQGTAEALSPPEMARLKALLETITFPPNRNRALEGRLSRLVQLPGFFARGKGAAPAGTPLAATRPRFAIDGCAGCHGEPSGFGVLSLGQHTNGLPFLHAALVERTEGKFLKVPHFRNLQERTGFNLDSVNSTAGFGFLHDGRADTLERLLQEGSHSLDHAALQSDSTLAAMIAFLISSTSTETAGPSQPGTRGAPPAFGRQFRLRTNDLSLLITNLTGGNIIAGPLVNPTNGVELILRGAVNGSDRAWLWQPKTRTFQCDKAGELLSLAEVERIISTDDSFSATIVSFGSGTRVALDRDADGFYNRDELESGSDPANPASVPPPRPLLSLLRDNATQRLVIRWPALPGRRYRLEQSSTISSGWVILSDITAAGSMEQSSTAIQTNQSRYYRLLLLPP